MRNESFYTTAAQVLPTLLIALVLEATTIFRRVVDLYSTREVVITVPHAEVAKPPAAVQGDVSQALWRDRDFRRLAAAFSSTVALFVLGEICALLAVFVGTDGWLVWLAAPATGLALLVMVLAVVAFPLVRVLMETMVQMDENVRATVVDEETGEVYAWLPQPSPPGEQRFIWGLRDDANDPAG